MPKFDEVDALSRVKLRNMFRGNQSDEFYRGFLTAILSANMLGGLVESGDDFNALTASLLAYLARCRVDGKTPGTA